MYIHTYIAEGLNTQQGIQNRIDMLTLCKHALLAGISRELDAAV